LSSKTSIFKTSTVKTSVIPPHPPHPTPPKRQRETKRDKERQRETKRDKERQSETKRDKERDKREAKRDKERQRETKRDKERQRETKIGRYKERILRTAIILDRQTDRQKDRQTDRQTEPVKNSPITICTIVHNGKIYSLAPKKIVTVSLPGGWEGDMPVPPTGIHPAEVHSLLTNSAPGW
jgi:hypothetical protein